MESEGLRATGNYRSSGPSGTNGAANGSNCGGAAGSGSGNLGLVAMMETLAGGNGRRGCDGSRGSQAIMVIGQEFGLVLYGFVFRRNGIRGWNRRRWRWWGAGGGENCRIACAFIAAQVGGGGGGGGGRGGLGGSGGLGGGGFVCPRDQNQLSSR